MRKGYLIAVVVIFAICIFLTIGIIVFNNTIAFDNVNENKIAENVNKTRHNTLDNSISLIETSSKENVISPNCIFIFKTYYQKCDHIKVEKKQAEEVMVNKSREDLEKIYKDWDIVTFRNDEVLFYQEKDDICDEHFILKELDGYIAIYSVDEHENEKLKQVTSIVVKYLTDEDYAKLKEGIRVNGKEELNRALEDYE